ncbi:MAG: hypothetical protein HKN87_18295 [Saprospiraceae bacterium]|nr:hypothetical protein [Saprospiraceae bacterium]
MIRLLQIEWLKLRYYRPFWIMLGMYTTCVILVCSSVMFFFEYIKSKGADFNGVDPTMIPFYDYPDVWQNLTYLASFLKVILAFIVIISIANENSYRTLRQNVIDGLSFTDFLKSKLIFIVVLALGATMLLWLNGLVMASIYSHVHGVEYMFQSTSFLAAYFLGLITYLTFAMMLTFLVPKAGLIIVGLFLYTLFFEPMLSTFIQYYEGTWDWLRPVPTYFPIMSIYYLIPIPFPRYFFMEIQHYILIKEVLIVVAWLVFNVFMSYLLLKKKDW